MAVPATPTDFTLVFYPDYPGDVWATITAGGSTHTGFYIRRYYDNGISTDWHTVHTINTTDLVVYDSGFSGLLSYTYRVFAFNADGESGYVTWNAVAVTATPTNLQYTRSGSSITVTWDGTLVSGDSWKVKLVDWQGYSDTITTVSANTETVVAGVWRNRSVQVYPTNTPANVATLSVTKAPPTQSAPTGLVAVFDVILNPTTIQLRVAFTCAWLQTAINESYPYTFLAYYSLTGNNDHQFDTIEDLGGGQFEAAGWVTTPVGEEQYFCTVALSTDLGSAPVPDHVIAGYMEADLVSLSMAHVRQNNYNDNTTDGSLGGTLLYPTDLITLSWVQTAGVLEVEFESKIDQSAWVPLFSVIQSGNGEEIIHADHKYGSASGTYLTSPDYTGDNRLDHTHFYQYSDGFLGDETTSNLRDVWFPTRNLLTHTVTVRGRKVGDVSWTESNEVVSVLRSIWHVKTKEPGWVEREFTDDVGLDGSRYRTYEGEQRPAVKYKTPDGIGLISHPPGVMVTPDQYIRAYVAGKSVQMLFTLDRGVTGHDLTDLQTGPQSWTATASSSTSGRTPDKAINGLTGADNSWQGATVYSGRGHVLTTADWWQCDLGAATMICGVRFWYAQPPGFRIYGSLTGAFTGEEVLMHTETDFYIALEKVLFYESHTVRYVRIYIDRLDTEGAFLTEPYAHAVMHEVGFYFGDLTYNSAYVDIETPAWAKHWFAAIPREKLDGISHLLRFKWVVTNPDTSVWHVFETPDFPCTLPTQDSIALPPSHVNIIRVS